LLSVDGKRHAMFEILLLVLVGVMVKDHSQRMKQLGKQARDYGKQSR
jgi:hypothetical protein